MWSRKLLAVSLVLRKSLLLDLAFWFWVFGRQSVYLHEYNYFKDKFVTEGIWQFDIFLQSPSC